MKGLERRVQLTLNAGDHVHMKVCFTDVLKEIGLERGSARTSTVPRVSWQDK